METNCYSLCILSVSIDYAEELPVVLKGEVDTRLQIHPGHDLEGLVDVGFVVHSAVQQVLPRSVLNVLDASVPVIRKGRIPGGSQLTAELRQQTESRIQTAQVVNDAEWQLRWKETPTLIEEPGRERAIPDI